MAEENPVKQGLGTSGIGTTGVGTSGMGTSEATSNLESSKTHVVRTLPFCRPDAVIPN